MKKFLSTLLSAMLLFTFTACDNSVKVENNKDEDIKEKEEKTVSSVKNLHRFIEENGVETDNGIELDCPDAAALISSYDFTIGAMANIQGSMKQTCTIIKNGDDISFRLIDSSITDSGLKLERSVLINADGTFEYDNGMVMNGSNFGVSLEGEIPVETYTKDKVPVITNSEFSAGGKMNDEVSATLKDYIDLSLDCYAKALSQEGIELTLADVGYAEY